MSRDRKGETEVTLDLRTTYVTERVLHVTVRESEECDPPELCPIWRGTRSFPTGLVMT